MDVEARQRLQEFVRATVCQDLDRMAGELARMHHRVALLEAAAEVKVRRPGIGGKVAAAAAMRREGLSLTVISLRLGVSKTQAARLVAEAGIEAPDRVRAIDGRMVPRRRVNGSRPQA